MSLSPSISKNFLLLSNLYSPQVLYSFLKLHKRDPFSRKKTIPGRFCIAFFSMVEISHFSLVRIVRMRNICQGTQSFFIRLICRSFQFNRSVENGFPEPQWATFPKSLRRANFALQSGSSSIFQFLKMAEIRLEVMEQKMNVNL